VGHPGIKKKKVPEKQTFSKFVTKRAFPLKGLQFGISLNQNAG